MPLSSELILRKEIMLWLVQISGRRYSPYVISFTQEIDGQNKLLNWHILRGICKFWTYFYAHFFFDRVQNYFQRFADYFQIEVEVEMTKSVKYCCVFSPFFFPRLWVSCLCVGYWVAKSILKVGDVDDDNDFVEKKDDNGNKYEVGLPFEKWNLPEGWYGWAEVEVRAMVSLDGELCTMSASQGRRGVRFLDKYKFWD